MTKNKLSHVAFILDGNKRWAKKNHLTKIQGYKHGFEKVKEIVDFSLKINLKNLTMFTLSSENINRSSIKIIFDIIYNNFSELIEEIASKKLIKINILGSKKNLPSKISKILTDAENMTCDNTSLNLNLAFNYGFKDEIKKALINYKENFNNINIDDDQSVRKLFHLGSREDPDLLIRTGGYKRLSNFIMYNLTYTELFFTDTLWPDFSESEFNKIIDEFSSINRKYGL